MAKEYTINLDLQSHIASLENEINFRMGKRDCEVIYTSRAIDYIPSEYLYEQPGRGTVFCQYYKNENSYTAKFFLAGFSETSSNFNYLNDFFSGMIKKYEKLNDA